MKKIYFLALFVFTAVATKAQTVTQAQLQGKWKMVGFKDENGSVDVANGTWKVNDNSVSPKEDVDEQYNYIVEQAREALLKIEGNTASQVVMSKEMSSKFTLEYKDGKTYLVTEGRGQADMVQVFIDKGQMHLVNTQIKAEMVYNRVK